MADEAPAKDPNDPSQRLTRAEAMEVVMRNRKANLLKHDMGPGENQPVVGSATSAPVDEDADLDTGAQLAAQSTPVVLADEVLSNYLVKTKVMGEERTVSLDDLRASAQKNEAADKFLKEAKEILENARATAAAVVPAKAAPEPVATDPGKPTAADAMVDSAIDLLYRGDTEEAKRLLKDAIKGNPSQAGAPPNLDQLAASLEQKVVVRSALRQFAKDYPAIVGDPVAREIADKFLSEMTEGKPLEAFPEDRIGKILADTGSRVMSWTRGLAGVPATGPTATTRDDRAQRKEAIDELPTAATRASTNIPQPKTTSETIAMMRAQRTPQLRDPTQT